MRNLPRSDSLTPDRVREKPVSTPFRAQIYRGVAHLLRELLAAVSTPETRADMEAKARQYDRLAESVEMADSEIRHIRH